MRRRRVGSHSRERSPKPPARPRRRFPPGPFILPRPHRSSRSSPIHCPVRVFGTRSAGRSTASLRCTPRISARTQSTPAWSPVSPGWTPLCWPRPSTRVRSSRAPGRPGPTRPPIPSAALSTLDAAFNSGLPDARFARRVLPRRHDLVRLPADSGGRVACDHRGRYGNGRNLGDRSEDVAVRWWRCDRTSRSSWRTGSRSRARCQRQPSLGVHPGGAAPGLALRSRGHRGRCTRVRGGHQASRSSTLPTCWPVPARSVRWSSTSTATGSTSRVSLPTRPARVTRQRHEAHPGRSGPTEPLLRVAIA